MRYATWLIAAAVVSAALLGGVFLRADISDASASPAETTLQELNANRLLWQAQNVDTYLLTYQVLCFCLWRDPIVAEVAGGTIVQLVDQDGTPLDPETTFSFTVEDLFDRIEAALARPADRLLVTYDLNLGIPVHLEIDQSFMIADEEITIDVLNFESVAVAQRSQRLEVGWNLTGWTGATPVVQATAAIASSFDSLYTWDARSQGFLSFSGDLPPALNTLQELRFGDGVWVHVTNPTGTDWPQPVFTSARSVPLLTGFNLAVWTGPNDFAVTDAVADIADSLNALYLWDAPGQVFLRYDPEAPGFANSATTLNHGDGVWLAASGPAVWEQPAFDDPGTQLLAVGAEVVLSPGDTVAIADTNLTVTFDRVTGDSRCPTDVVCVTAGEATVHLTTNLAGRSDSLAIVVAPAGPVTATIDAFDVTVLEVGPEPLSTRPIDPGAYRVRLVVDRDQ